MQADSKVAGVKAGLVQVQVHIALDDLSRLEGHLIPCQLYIYISALKELLFSLFASWKEVFDKSGNIINIVQTISL